jgi:hypothetical protein
MIYTAPCVRFLMLADTLPGEGGGRVGAGNLEFFVGRSVKLHEPIGECN